MNVITEGEKVENMLHELYVALQWGNISQRQYDERTKELFKQLDEMK